MKIITPKQLMAESYPMFQILYNRNAWSKGKRWRRLYLQKQMWILLQKMAGFLSFNSKGGVPQTATLSLKWICCGCFFLKLLFLERFAAATGEVVSVKDNRLQGLGCGDSRFSCWRLAGGWSELLLTLLEAHGFTAGSGEDVMGCWTMKKIKCWNSCWCYCSAGTLSLLCWK